MMIMMMAIMILMMAIIAHLTMVVCGQCPLDISVVCGYNDYDDAYNSTTYYGS